VKTFVSDHFFSPNLCSAVRTDFILNSTIAVAYLLNATLLWRQNEMAGSTELQDALQDSLVQLQQNLKQKELESSKIKTELQVSSVFIIISIIIIIIIIVIFVMRKNVKSGK